MSGLDDEEDEDEESAADVTPNNSKATLTNGISNHNDTAGSVDWGAPVTKPQTADSFDWGAPVSSSKPQTADSMDWGAPVTSNSKCRILLFHLTKTIQNCSAIRPIVYMPFIEVPSSLLLYLYVF